MDNKIKIINPNLPSVAIVGRPNVGKSTLFNRIIGKKKASVYDTPGLTRDRNYGIAEWLGLKFLLIDTGGYETRTDTIYDLVRKQAELAIEEADIILLVTDVGDTVNPVDEDILSFIRKKGKPFLMLVNKCDSHSKEIEASDFARFGLDKYYTISAQHGLGLEDCLDEIKEKIPDKYSNIESDDIDEGIRISVVGRQNVGKSTLINKILGQERVIASDLPGTTRDAIDTTFVMNERTYTLIDTAGMRKRGKIERGVEFLSYLSAVKSIERSHIAILVLDIADGIREQDTHIAGLIRDKGCGCIVVANKWDKVEKDSKTIDKYKDDILYSFNFLNFAPIIFTSALTGQRVIRIFDLINKVYDEGGKKIDTPELNKAFERFQRHLNPPSLKSGKQLSIKYVVHTGTHPPTFTLFVNDPKILHFSYERYLFNQIRKEFGFEGNPIKFILRKKS